MIADPGIQMATYFGGYRRFGCYGKPPTLLKTDDLFQLVGKYMVDCALGIVALPDGRFLIGRGPKNIPAPRFWPMPTRKRGYPYENRMTTDAS